jgi:hypothetical protein
MNRQPTYWYRLNSMVKFEDGSGVLFTIDLEAYRLPGVGESISVFGANDMYRLRITEIIHPSQHEGELYVTFVPSDENLDADNLVSALNEEVSRNNLTNKAELR